MSRGEEAGKPLGLVAMTALVVGSLIGSGIFSLPQNMAEGAHAGAILIAWGITFAGMLALTRVFQWLALNSSSTEDGIYGYARAGFGEFMGFNVAWGYWISVWVTLVSYLVVLFGTLGSFPGLEVFGEGNTLAALVGGLVLLWALHGFILLGVRTAALVNVVVTIAKLIPIALFVVCVTMAFEIDTFRLDFWGGEGGAPVLTQVRTTMLYTVFVFMGIETATVYANRSRDRRVVSRATLLGFLVTLLLLLAVSLLSLGVVPAEELAAMRNPSMAQVLAKAVGPWGATVINAGLIVSVSGALLAWTLVTSEILYLASRGESNTAPRIFGRLNRHGTPANALWLTNVLVSVFLVINYFSDAGYNLFIQLASSMVLIPFFICSAYALQVIRGAPPRSSWSLQGLAVLACLYGLWLIYAGGLRFLLLSMVLYLLGIPFYLWARRERSQPAFASGAEAGIAVLVLVLGLAALYLLGTGGLTL